MKHLMPFGLQIVGWDQCFAVILLADGSSEEKSRAAVMI